MTSLESLREIRAMKYFLTYGSANRTPTSQPQEGRAYATLTYNLKTREISVRPIKPSPLEA